MLIAISVTLLLIGTGLKYNQFLQEKEEAERLRRQELQDQTKERLRIRQDLNNYQSAEEELSESIDFYIRTRNKFDSRFPTDYWCSIPNISSDYDVKESFAEFLKFWFLVHSERMNSPISMLEVLRKSKLFITDETDQWVRARYCTPFQGSQSHRVFGYFSCGKCKKEWNSAATWTNKWQGCKKCESKCYPFDQHPLEIKEDEDDRDDGRKLPHDMARCERCIESGKICLPNMYYAR